MLLIQIKFADQKILCFPERIESVSKAAPPIKTMNRFQTCFKWVKQTVMGLFHIHICWCEDSGRIRELLAEFGQTFRDKIATTLKSTAPVA